MSYMFCISVESLGYKREDVLSFSDKENNMPLHCAVNSGDLKVNDKKRLIYIDINNNDNDKQY